MKTSFKMVAMLLGIGVFPVCAQAQKKIVIEDEEPNSIMFVSRDKAGDEIIRIMNDRSQMRFHDPNAPRFLLTDQKGKFALGIGGYVRATGEYDFNGIVDDVDFYPALIGRPGKGNFAKNQFQMDITTSTLFLKLVGRTKHLGDFVVYTAGNFRGDGKTFELQMLMHSSSVSQSDTATVRLWTFRPCLLLSTSPVRTVQLSIVPRN